MENLTLILLLILIFSLLFNYLSFSYKMTSFEIVNDMGIGINFGNTFDCFVPYKNISSPEEQITLLGNSFPTKKMILNIKKSGFKTIRLPITWLNFMDELGNINSEWISQIKEVVQWVINNNMYCIINVHHDGKSGNWLSRGLISKNKYDKLWTQIAKEFKDFNEYLIFESMNEVEFVTESGDYDYETLHILTQSFIDIVRNSGGINSKRFLIISGANTEIYLSISEDFKLPSDPVNNFGVSIHYYYPYEYTKQHINENGRKDWGDELDFEDIMGNFYMLKKSFLDKNIPVIVDEVGVLTEDGKDIDTMKEYLYIVFSLVAGFDGMMCCLWDTSNKEFGDMNYYNRVTKKWYDEKIKKFLSKIAQGKYVSMWDFFINTNQIPLQAIDYDSEGNVVSYFLDDLTLSKLIFYVRYNGNYSESDIELSCDFNDGTSKKIEFSKKNGIKQYDGTTKYTVNVLIPNCTDYFNAIKLKDPGNIIFKNFTLEFYDEFDLFDMDNYKESVLKSIN